jgi:hypothetical protein
MCRVPCFDTPQCFMSSTRYLRCFLCPRHLSSCLRHSGLRWQFPVFLLFVTLPRCFDFLYLICCGTHFFIVSRAFNAAFQFSDFSPRKNNCCREIFFSFPGIYLSREILSSRPIITADPSCRVKFYFCRVKFIAFARGMIRP